MTVPINQLAIYALLIVLGWLLGLLSRSGGGVWRRKYEAERDARVALETAHHDRDAAARTRIAELERHSRRSAPPPPVRLPPPLRAGATTSR